MKYTDIKIGQVVYDRWWPDRFGTVIDKLKTRVKIRFIDEVRTYSLSHFQFLELAKPNGNKLKKRIK